MKIIVACLMLISLLNADEFSWDNEFEIQAGQYHRGKAENGEINKLALMTYTPIINYNYNNWSFNFIPMFTHMEAQEPVMNSITGETYESNDLFVKSMHIKYDAGKHKFLAGILSFSYNGYLGYKNDYFERGEGLHTIIDKDILGLMYIYDYSDELSLKFVVGGSWYNRDSIPTGDYDNYLEKDFIFITNYKKGKIRIDSTLLHQQSYARDDEYYMGCFTALGLGVVYDDSEYSGIVLYNILSGSYEQYEGITPEHLSLHTGAAADTIRTDPTYVYQASNETGWSNLIGMRKDFDINQKEFFVNLEWYHTEGNFISANLGNIYKGDATDMFYAGDDSYSATLGYMIDDTQYIKFVYSFVDFDALPAVGNPAVSIPVEEHSLGDTTSYTYVKVLWNIKF